MTIAKTAAILEVDGTLQSEHGVVHLVAERLHESTGSRSGSVTRSRDFH